MSTTPRAQPRGTVPRADQCVFDRLHQFVLDRLGEHGRLDFQRLLTASLPRQDDLTSEGYQHASALKFGVDFGYATAAVPRRVFWTLSSAGRTRLHGGTAIRPKVNDAARHL